MKVVHDQLPAFFWLLNQELDSSHSPRTSYLITLVDDLGFALAICALSDWGEHNVELTLATDNSKRWANRRFLRAIGDFCFADNARTRITSITDSRNVAWGKQLQRLGFVNEGRLQDWYGPGRTGELYCLSRATYNRARWARGTLHGQKACSTAAGT